MDTLLDQVWRHLSAGAPHGGAQAPSLGISGRPSSSRLPSPLPVEDAALACVGAALLAAAELGAVRSGRRPEVSLDRQVVSEAVISERRFRIDGRWSGLGFAPLSRFWPTADGWVRTHANYPWHRSALLEALGIGRGPEDEAAAVTAACALLPADQIEQRVTDAGGVAAAVRTAAEWATHPQGRAVMTEPVVSHQELGPAPARRRRGGGLPAAGVRVLDLTRVIAGPVCTRFLGALGADVLRIDPPSHPDMTAGGLADTLLGKRSAALDLRRADALNRLHHLTDEADVVVCGYRPGALDRYGLGPEELAQRHPGLIVVYLGAWGHTGPWRNRRGFDSVVQAPTGIAMISGEGSSPGALPCQLLDHGTGYLAAAAVLDGLVRQAREGGTHVRRLSLAATAAWLVSAGASVETGGGALVESDSDPPPLVRLVAGPAEVRAVPPPGAIDGVALTWPGPPSRYLADTAEWTPA